MSTKVRCDIDGLDCPHCALELQSQMSKLEGVEQATINFATKSLIVEVSDSDVDEEQLVERLQAAADKFSDGISVELRD